LIPSTKNARRRAAPQTSLRAFSTDQLSPFRSIPGFPQHEILQNIAPLAARKWAAARAARDLAIHRFWIGLCPDSAVRSLTMRATKCWFGTPPASNPPRLTRPHFNSAPNSPIYAAAKSKATVYHSWLRPARYRSRQLPDQSTILRVEPSSTDEHRLSINHLTESLGLMRRASAKAVFA
jgi:hypothetical protein